MKNKLLIWADKLVSLSKYISAIGFLSTTIVGLLIWIAVTTSSIYKGIKDAVAIVPVVAQNSKDIEQIKKDYGLIAESKRAIDEIQQRYILTEIDFMINIILTQIYKDRPLDMATINKLLFYRSSLTFLSNQQINNINYIEIVADKHGYKTSKELYVRPPSETVK